MIELDQKQYKTFSYRVKGLGAVKALSSFSFAVNQVWNHCCASGRHSVRHNQRWLTKAQLYASTKGSSKELGVNSQTVQAVVETYYDKRKAARRPFLRWRKSGGVRRSLGWVPFKNQTVDIDGAKVTYGGKTFYLWKHRELEGKFVSGSFAEDARGRWYANFVCEIAPKATNRTAVAGVDLGLKTAAHSVIVEQDGGKREVVIKQSRFYRDMEAKLAEAQRRGRKRQVKTIHAKIANRRKDALHKYSRQLVNQAGYIFIGNVSSSFAISSAAKSALDVSWATLRNLVKYKSANAGVVCEEVSEAWTTQTCSDCGSISGPKGREGLEVRQWVCSECETVHDRDANAALNIARFGCETLGLKWPGSPCL
jgi:IS605 OrfB family transposase